jgi:hypothetical protein
MNTMAVNTLQSKPREDRRWQFRLDRGGAFTDIVARRPRRLQRAGPQHDRP